jgi:hypothetical protein
MLWQHVVPQHAFQRGENEGKKNCLEQENGVSNLLDCVVVIIVNNYAITSSFPAL